jgi:hypothetical protein
MLARMTCLRTTTHIARICAVGIALVLLIGVTGCGAHAAADGAVTHHPPKGLFDDVRGWLAVGGDSVVALDPDLPRARVVLLNSPGSPLAWSLDGTNLLISSPPHGYDVLWSDGRLVHVAPRNATGGSFTWNGDAVIYGTPDGTFTVSAAGGTPHRVSAHRLTGYGFGWQPSPAGSIPFLDRGDIWVMHSDGTHRRLLVRGSAIQAQAGPRKVVEINLGGWTRDGSQYAFTTSSAKPFTCSVFVVESNGADLHRVPTLSRCPWGANWSFDGQNIVTSTYPMGLTIMDTRGRPIRTIPGVGQNGSFAWNTARRPERSIGA